jgi:predicted  nucleic acid-binding Zn-ribbon protein
MTMTGTTKLHPGMSRKEAVRAFVEMRETLRRFEAENEDLRKRLKEANEAAREWQNTYAMNEIYGPTQLEMLRARVAELEAQLAAAHACIADLEASQ